MGYRIAYRAMPPKVCRKRFSVRLPILTLLCFSLFLVLVATLWPEGKAYLQEALLFSQETVAASALNELAEELYAGAEPMTAFVDFFERLLS